MGEWVGCGWLGTSVTSEPEWGLVDERVEWASGRMGTRLEAGGLQEGGCDG